jgi:ketosteroid isomerase-like protein
MSQQNVELVRSYYEAVNRGDEEAVERMIAPDFVADASRRLIEPGVVYGREAAAEAAARVRDAWEVLILEPEELIPVGDRVVAVVHNRARGKASGVDVESRTGQVWTVRDGLIVHFEYFGTRAEALEAVGLPER